MDTNSQLYKNRQRYIALLRAVDAAEWYEDTQFIWSAECILKQLIKDNYRPIE